MNFHNTQVEGESREAWQQRVLATYPEARFYRYSDGAMCALSESPLQPSDWSPRWRVGQWNRYNGGHLHMPENLALHLTAVQARDQWFRASVETYYASANPAPSSVPFCRLQH